MDFQTGQQLLNARILVLTSDFHKYGSAGTLNPIKIPQTRRTPIISFLFEAVDAADFGQIVGLIDCVFVLVKSIAGEIITEGIRRFNGNPDFRINDAFIFPFLWDRQNNLCLLYTSKDSANRIDSVRAAYTFFISSPPPFSRQQNQRRTDHR